MNKRFIILIDFSKYSGNLLQYALEWSQEVDAHLHLVHQTTVFAPALSGIEYRESLTRLTNEEAFRKLKNLADTILPPIAKVSYSVSDTPLRFTLQNLLSEPYENLIFAGLKGTGLLRKIFMGSEVIQLIDKVNNTLVAIPKDISRFNHEKIFVAVNEKYPLNIDELTNFLKFVDKGTSNITFFHLAKPDEKAIEIEKQLQDLSELFADRFNTDFAIYRGNNAFADIQKVINNKVDEILIIQKGSRLLTDQFFRRFLINELVWEGETPLIVLP
jgi:hypothetical protein